MFNTNYHKSETLKARLNRNYIIVKRGNNYGRNYLDRGQIARSFCDLIDIYSAVKTGSFVLEYEEYNTQTNKNDIKEKKFNLIRHYKELKKALYELDKSKFRGIKYKVCKRYAVSNPCKNGSKRNAKNFLYADSFVLDIDSIGEKLTQHEKELLYKELEKFGSVMEFETISGGVRSFFNANIISDINIFKDTYEELGKDIDLIIKRLGLDNKIKVDKSCNDVVKLYFLYYDPNARWHEDNLNIKIDERYKDIVQEKQNKTKTIKVKAYNNIVTQAPQTNHYANYVAHKGKIKSNFARKNEKNVFTSVIGLSVGKRSEKEYKVVLYAIDNNYSEDKFIDTCNKYYSGTDVKLANETHARAEYKRAIQKNNHLYDYSFTTKTIDYKEEKKQVISATPNKPELYSLLFLLITAESMDIDIYNQDGFTISYRENSKHTNKNHKSLYLSLQKLVKDGFIECENNNHDGINETTIWKNINFNKINSLANDTLKEIPEYILNYDFSNDALTTDGLTFYQFFTLFLINEYGKDKTKEILKLNDRNFNYITGVLKVKLLLNQDFTTNFFTQAGLSDFILRFSLQGSFQNFFNYLCEEQITYKNNVKQKTTQLSTHISSKYNNQAPPNYFNYTP